MKIKLHLRLCLSFLLLTSCSKDDAEETFPIVGEYHISQITSNIPVDIDDDGVASIDMMSEIHDFFGNLHYYDMKILKNSLNFGPDLYLYFSFPQMNISYYNLSYPQGYNVFSRSGTSFSVDYNKKNNRATIQDYDKTSEYYQQFGGLESVEVLDGDHINAVYKKKFYDFHTAQWIELTLNIKYDKMVEPSVFD